MSETKKETLLEIIEKNLKVRRQDLNKWHKLDNETDSERDKNTLAKSVIDDIIEETENDSNVIEKDFSSRR